MTRTKPTRAMRRGERVRIFTDPITREKPEGFATLVDRTDWRRGDAPPEHDERGRPYELESWMVRFDGEVETYRRTIRVDLEEAGTP